MVSQTGIVGVGSKSVLAFAGILSRFINIAKISVVKTFVSFVAGCALQFAFAPYDIWILAYIAPLFLLWVWSDDTPTQAFIHGQVYGVGLYSVGLFWLKTCLSSICQYQSFVSILITACLIMVLAFFTAIVGYLLKKNSIKFTAANLLLAFPSYWAISEWVRGTIFSGFPWLSSGYSQLESWLKFFAPVCGVNGISWLVMFNVVTIYICLFKTKIKFPIKLLACSICMALWFGGYCLQYVDWVRLEYRPHSVAIVQSNIPATEKRTNTKEQNLKILEPLTTPSFGANLIVWPELSYPYIFSDSDRYVNELHAMAKQYNSTLVFGAFTLIDKSLLLDRDLVQYYNSLYVVGAGNGVYYKEHLVPMGENLPFSKLLIPFFKKIGRDLPYVLPSLKKQISLHLPVGNLLPLICYEAIFAEEVRSKIKSNAAETIVIISEDGWLGDSAGGAQHFQMVRMRALENARYLIRSATSGISAVVDNKGQVVSTCPPNTACVINSMYYNATGFTPWTYTGTMFWIPIMLLLALCSFIPRFLKRKL